MFVTVTQTTSAFCRTVSGVAETLAKPAALSQAFMDKEKRFGAHNYKPIPAVIAKGKGQ